MTNPLFDDALKSIDTMVSSGGQKSGGTQQATPAGATSSSGPRVRFDDTRWDAAEMEASRKTGVPVEVIRTIRTVGERSHSDQVSPVGARGVYQFMPKTRQLFLNKYGVDAFSADPVEQAMAAALHLKESYQRTKDWNRAMAGYNGGTSAESGTNKTEENRNYAARTAAALGGRGGAPAAGERQGGAPSSDAPASQEFYRGRRDHQGLNTPAMPERSTMESAKDSLVALGAGLAGGTGALAAVAGADNPVAKFANKLAKDIEASASPYRQEQRKRAAEAIEEAEQTGSAWAEIKANASAFMDAPLDNMLGAIGSSAPTLLSTLIPGLGQANAARFIVQGAMGAAQGAGAVKSSIYESVERDVTKHYIAQGIDPKVAASEAAKVAAGAQAYDSANGGQIALGGLLGALAGTTGAEASLSKIVGGGAGGAALKKSGQGFLKEGSTEAIQGGQERLAGNIALQNEGFDVPTWQGVAGQATTEGLAGGLMGGGFGAAEGLENHRAQQAQAPAVAPGLKSVAAAAEAGGTLSRAAMAGNTPEAVAARSEAQAPSQIDASARLAELEEIAKNGESGRFFTEAEKTEYDQLTSLRNATQQVAGRDKPAEDQVADRVAHIEQTLRAPGAMDAARQSGVDTKALVNDLATAKSKSTRADLREQAMARVEYALGSFGAEASPAAQGSPSNDAADDSLIDSVIQDPATPEGDKLQLIAAQQVASNQALPEADRVSARDGAIRLASRHAADAGVKEAERMDRGAQQFLDEGFEDEAADLQAQASDLRSESAALQQRAGAPVDVAAPAVRTPNGSGPAYARRRRATLDQLVADGLDRVERRGSDFYLSNHTGKRQFKLEGPADAAMARAAVASHIKTQAGKANTAPSDAQKEAGNYKTGELKFDGMTIAIENPQGSTRSGTDPSGRKWETVMPANYGYIRGSAQAADGDKVDIYLPNNARAGSPVHIIDQYNADGSFDETKTVMGVATEAEAIRIYDAGFSDGSGPDRRGAVTVMSVAEFKDWSSSPAAKKPAGKPKDKPKADLTIKVAGKPVSVQLVDQDKLGATDSVARGGKALNVTQQQGRSLAAIAATFGKRVQFFAADGVGDGFVMPTDTSTVFINASTGVSPLAVFGHELMHLLKKDNPKAHAAIEKVVGERLKASARDEYKALGYGDGEILEEITSDLGGDLLADPKFWGDVMEVIQDQGAIAKMIGLIRNLVDKLAATIRQGGYGADKLVDDMASIREAIKVGMASYAKQSAVSTAKLQADAIKAEQAAKRSAPRAHYPLAPAGKRYEETSKPITMMSPDEYLARVRPLDIDEASRDNIDDLKEHIKAGRDLDPLHIRADGKEDGRHRAHAAKELGIELVPVVDEQVRRSVDREIGIHYSKQPRATLDGRFNGTGMKGAEARRLEASTDSRIKERVYVYLDGRGPESGVGGYAHEVEVTNLYDADADPQKLWTGGDINAIESRILDAGFNGYKTGGVGIIMGQASHAVPAKSLNGEPITDAPRKASLMSREINMLNVSAIPGAAMRMGTLTVPPSSVTQANAEFERIGSSIRFSKERVNTPAREYEAVEKRLRGTDQWMKAPNGKPTKLSERQWVHVRTPSFKAWFGDWEADPTNASQAVDENLEPAVVYHGTSNGGFSAFRETSGEKRGDMGIFLTPNRDMASSYVRRGKVKDITESDVTEEADTGGIYALFANIRNPNEANFEGALWNGNRDHQWIVDVVGEPYVDNDGRMYYDEATAKEIATEMLSPEDVEDGRDWSEYARPADEHYQTTDDVVDEGRRYGNDGSVIFEVVDDGGGNGYYDHTPSTVYVAFDPAQVKSADFNDGSYSADEADIRRSAERVNRHGFWPQLLDEVKGKVTLPKKALMVQSTNNRNAARQVDAIDDVLKKHPTPEASDNHWNRMMAYALADRQVPIPPYQFIKRINDGSYGELLGSLSAGQIADSEHGFANAAEFRKLYTSGQADVVTTGKLMLWSFLSRGVSPYVQESLFMDAISGIEPWVQKAAAGKFGEAELQDYLAWSDTIVQPGSGRPGAGSKHNLNAFGASFLTKMSQAGEDGRTHLQRLHDLMADANVTGPEVRREFVKFSEGVGIDNKVISFTLLVSGRDDVMVLDRVQIRSLWDDGRFAGTNLYDGISDADGKPVTGSSLASLASGARGLLIYEAIERAISRNIKAYYEDAGRPESASIGRFHWETWVAYSGQEASHGTIDGLMREAAGQPEPYQGVTAKEGEYGSFAYGARYGVDSVGAPYFLYENSKGKTFKFDIESFRELLATAKKPANKVIPTKFLVSKDENGNNRTAPWFKDGRVNRGVLDALIEKHGVEQEGGRTLPADAQVTINDGAGSRGDVKRSAERDRAGRIPSPGEALLGAPQVKGATGPDPRIVAVAQAYAEKVGIKHRRQAEYVQVDPARARRIADAYEAMEHKPQDPRVKEAYQNLIEQTLAQYHALADAGYQFYFADQERDPYAGNPWAAMRDMRANRRMAVFPTTEGFGTNAEFDPEDNPLLADTGLHWPFGSMDGELHRVLANDLFRAVHDAFGHGLEGSGFRAQGEENAWQAHVRLFHGSAIGAITTETRGQNSWLNYNAVSGEKNQTAKVEDTVFADQKTGLLPEWVWHEGRAADIETASDINERIDAFEDLIACLKK